MTGHLLTVAHRAGNDPRVLRAALDAGADLVEADVHAFRGRLEIRHRKSLGPWWLWDRWELVRRRHVNPPVLSDLVTALDGDERLLLDLKSVHPLLARRVVQAFTSGAGYAVCGQHWWMFRAFPPSVRVVRSAGSRRGLRRLRARLRHGPPVYGVSVHRRLLTPEVVAELRQSAQLVLTWPVDTPDALADAHRLGVGGVIGKDLGVLLDGSRPARPT
jgi:glycerophosphoryl diester phosphodiesterase